MGDCVGRDVARTSGPTPDPAKCDNAFAGNTAVCWATGCTYKNVATGLCTGGTHPGPLYTCAASAPLPLPPPPLAPAKVQGKHYAITNYTGDTKHTHEFVVDWKACKVAEVNQDYERGAEEISIVLCRINSRLIIKTELRNTSNSVQYDWVVLDNGATLAGSYYDQTTHGPSLGKRK
jgi:hypothetical protein